MLRSNPWGRVLSAAIRALTAIASRAGILRKSGAAISGPAPITETQRRSADALLLTSLECQIAHLKSLKPSDPRRGKIIRAIYSARHEILFGRRK